MAAHRVSTRAGVPVSLALVLALAACVGDEQYGDAPADDSMLPQDVADSVTLLEAESAVTPDSAAVSVEQLADLVGQALVAADVPGALPVLAATAPSASPTGGGASAGTQDARVWTIGAVTETNLVYAEQLDGEFVVLYDSPLSESGPAGEVLADFEVSLLDAAEAATEVVPGQILWSIATVPAAEPYYSVLVLAADGQRVRLFVDGVSGEVVNAVPLG